MIKTYEDTTVTGYPLRFPSDMNLPDGIYTDLVQKTVISCVDAVPFDRTKRVLYLACRSVYPQKGVWVLGGRLLPSDRTAEEGLSRKLVAECGLTISPARFQYLTTNFYRWDWTRQGGSGANLAVTFSFVVLPTEIEIISAGLVKSEYQKGFGLQPYTAERLSSEGCHPALLDMYLKLFA